MQTGSLVPTSNGGGFGIVLSARTIATDESGRDLNLYRIRPISGISRTTGNPVDGGREPHNAFSSTAGLQAPEGLGTPAGARLVDPETLTAAQAQALGVSPRDLQRVRDQIADEERADQDRQKQSADEPEAQGKTRRPGKKLTPEERAEVARLRAVDSAVRQEEEAHAAAAGAFAGAPQYQYTVGPDDRQYAISGHVDIKANVSGPPEQVERALKTIQAAALAPNNPSGADLSAFRSAVADQGAIRASRNSRDIFQALNASRTALTQPQGTPRVQFAAAADAYRRTINH